MRKKKYIAILMVLITLMAFMPAAEINASAELRRQLQELEQQRNAARTQLHESQNLLEGVRAEIADLLEIMRDYNQRIMDAYADLEEIEIVLLETEIHMIDAEIELMEAREHRDTQKALFRTRLRAMHEQGPVGYLEVLFQSTSFSDFLVRLEHVCAVSQFDQDLPEMMQAAEERVENTMNELARLHTLFEHLQKDRQVAFAALEDVQDANAAMLASMYEDEAQAQLLF